MSDKRFVMISDADGNMFVIDVVVSESHSWTSDITEFPVESGGDVSDNVRPKSLQVELSGVVSDSPLAEVARIREQARATRAQLANASNLAVISAAASANLTPPPSAPSKPSDDALAHFTAIRDARKPVTIVTSLKTYQSMVLESLEVQRSSSTAAGLHFTAKFVEIKIITNRRYVRVSVPRAMKTKTANKPTDAVLAKPENAYNERLPLYRVIGIPGSEQFYYWFDDAIGGWRSGVTHDVPTKHISTTEGVLGGGVTGGDPVYSDGWIFSRGKPYGARPGEQYSDATWKSLIQESYASAPRDPDGSPASVSSNRFDPFTSFGADGESISSANVRIVHGRMFDDNPTLRAIQQ